ncbi:leukotoxin [bacterium MnTg02]|nr:leukotoxin [bacterium MnTg02]
MTIEVQFSSTQAVGGDINLFGYHVGGASDEIELGINDYGSGVGLYVEIGEQAVAINSYDATQLLDGGDHQVSLTWDNTAGDWEIYVDGNSVASGTGIAAGHTIVAGGMVVLGQEQDSPGGGFDPDQNFDGTYNDVRIFDDVRTATEISNNVFNEVSSSEPGLVVDWQMDDLSGGITTDAVSGNDLSVGNVTGAGWVASTPTLVNGVYENASTGAVVATLSTVDPDGGDSHTYQIVDGGGNPVSDANFELLGNEIRVKAGASLDYETDTSHSLNIKATDSGGYSYTEAVTINVNDVIEINLAPTDLTLSSNSVDENSPMGTVVGTLAAVDPDGGDTFIYTLTDDAGGRFQIDAATGELKVSDGAPLDYEADTSHNVTVEVTDSASNTYSETFAIDVNNIADGSTFTGGGGDDDIDTGSGDDTLIGNDGDDKLRGRDGDDVLFGGDGEDELRGDEGNDVLYGGADNDDIRGDEGDDVLVGGLGNDDLDGGDGSDLFIFAEGDGNDTALGGGGVWTDTVLLQDASGGSNIGIFGVDWTLNLTEGSIQSQDANSITLSDEADGTITLQDGSVFDFTDFERIEF